MGIAIATLVLFILVIVVWSVFLHRKAGESMFFGWIGAIAVVAVGAAMGMLPRKATFANILGRSLLDAIREPAFFAVVIFSFTACLMGKTGIITRLAHILNSIFGKIPGGSGYAATLASGLVGMISSSGAENAAVCGSVFIPWMKESGFSRDQSAIITAGNAGAGQCLPLSTGFFTLLAMPVIADSIDAGQMYIASLCLGAWIVAVRLITVAVYVKKYHIQPACGSARSLSETIRADGRSLWIVAALLIPLILTAVFDKTGFKTAGVLYGTPVLLVVVTLIEGHTHLPGGRKAWGRFFADALPAQSNIWIAAFFAFAGASVTKHSGLSDEIKVIFDQLPGMDIPFPVTLILIGLIVVIIAGPLSPSATLASCGTVCFSALTALGVNPYAALCVIMCFSSTAGQTPPSAGPLFVACGIAGLEDPNKCFRPLIVNYTLATLIVGVLIGLGLLPIYYP
jgi:TRAP-type C4-dicarboxylate transport system permease large subunit